jgi:hypothetical protein
VTLEQFETACGKTLLLLAQRTGHTEPRRDPDAPTSPWHLRWMLIEAALFYRDNRIEKANRWLGYAQGVMAALHYATLDQLKAANMPEGALCDAERVGGEP